VIEIEMPPAEQVALPEPEPPAEEEETVPVTLTSAKVFEEQGHLEKALDIYSQLEKESPGDRELENKIRELVMRLTMPAEPAAASPEEQTDILERWLKNIEAFRESMRNR
jgi:cobalamin biosynthesis Mg chelatase CobN